MIEHIIKAFAAAIIAVAVLGSMPASAALRGNGVLQNGLWQNGLWQNGLWQNGIGAKGRVRFKINTAGELVIDSNALVSVELPR